MRYRRQQKSLLLSVPHALGLTIELLGDNNVFFFVFRRARMYKLCSRLLDTSSFPINQPVATPSNSYSLSLILAINGRFLLYHRHFRKYL